MKNRNLYSVVILAVILSLNSSMSLGEELVQQLTLHECLEIANENNIKMIETKKEIETAKSKLIQAGAYPNPEIEVDDYGLLNKLGTGESDREIKLSQEIEVLGKRRNRTNIAKTEIEIFNQKLNSIWAEVRFDVKTKYNEILLIQKKKELATENLNLARNFLANIQMKYESGKALINQVIRAKIEVSRAENELLIIEKDISIRKAELNLLLNRPPGYKFLPVDELIYLKKTLDLDDLTKKTLAQNPELKIELLSSDLAKMKLSLSKRETISNPVIGILQKQESQEKTLGVNLGLSIPLWYRKQGEIQESKIELEKINSKIDYLRKEMELKIFNAFIETELAEKQVILLKNTVKEANELLRVVSLQYKEGKSDFLSYLEHLVTLKNTKANYYEAVFNYNQKITLIEKVISEEI